MRNVRFSYILYGTLNVIHRGETNDGKEDEPDTVVQEEMREETAETAESPADSGETAQSPADAEESAESPRESGNF